MLGQDNPNSWPPEVRPVEPPEVVATDNDKHSRARIGTGRRCALVLAVTCGVLSVLSFFFTATGYTYTRIDPPQGVDFVDWIMRSKSASELTFERVAEMEVSYRYEWPRFWAVSAFICWLIFAVEGLRQDLRFPRG